MNLYFNMTELETSKENLKDSQKWWLLETENNLSDLKVWTSLSWLRAEVSDRFNFRGKLKKRDTEKAGWNVESNKWTFEYKNESKDKEYDVYVYTVKKWWKPKDVIKQAVKQGLAKKKEWILITNQDWEPYEKKHKFSAWDQVYVKIPKKISNRSAWNWENKETQSTHQVDAAGWWRSKLDSREHPENKRAVSEQWMYDRCVEYWIKDKRQIAYILATVKREAPNPSWSWFLNRREIWRWSWKAYWRVDESTWYTYYGRGFVQLTWKDNYRKMTNKIKSSWKSFKDNDGNILRWSEIDLVNNPEIILKSNELAAFITICWMKYWIFTWKKLDDYINDKGADYIGARRIVNWKDHASKVAKNARKYLDKLWDQSLGSLENSWESSESFWNGLSGIETDLSNLRYSTSLTSLQFEVYNWILVNNEGKSRDWNYNVYSLVSPSICTPSIIKRYASKYLSSKNSEWIKITNEDWKEYGQDEQIPSWEKVYIKISKDEQIQWIPVYENKSSDGYYDVYSYIYEDLAPLFAFSFKEKIAKKLNLQSMMWIKITDINWNEYDDSKLVFFWEKVYIKVPNMKSGGWTTESFEWNLETSSWDFEYKKESKDGKYDVYSYKIKTWWKSVAVRAKAVAQWLADKKDGILITRRSWKPYDENHEFEPWDKVYVKIPKRQEASSWGFEYKKESKDGNYDVYSYKIKTWWKPAAVRAKAVAQWLADKKDGILITRRSWKPYDENHEFEPWDKVYVKIPKDIESESVWSTEMLQTDSSHTNPERQQESIEMKCKLWEYFWIDISHFNNFDLQKFENWNRESRDYEGKKDGEIQRWVSFVYIRSSDWVATDSKLKTHLDGVTKYNRDMVSKGQSAERVAVWFYHRMNWLDAKKQAEHFISLYKKNIGKSWWKDLVPMCDVENGSAKPWRLDRRRGESKEENRQRVRTSVLTWLKAVESWTWVVPWIYIGLNNYENYINWDERFDKYKDKLRISAYSKHRKDRFAESWAIDRKKKFKPTVYQSSETWKVGWTWNKSWYTDIDHVKEDSMKNLFVE